jgi:1-acyl-sn-glycerol-3-phosphate acyltransferase
MQGDIVAGIFLVLVACVLLGWMLYVLIRPPLHPVQNLFMLMARLCTIFLWRTVNGPFPHLPQRGLVVVCNHRSSVDPFFVQASTLRGIYWMVAREFVDHKAFRWFLEKCEVIPVNRGGIDTAATKIAIRKVSLGQVVGMFPEGRINMSERLFLPGRPGAAMVAIKSRGAIVPCYIQGAPYWKVAWSPFFMPATVRVKYGEVIDSDLYADRVEAGEDEMVVAAELLMRIMKAMAVLAGQPDFEPELAGRNWKPTAEELAAAMEEQERRLKRR